MNKAAYDYVNDKTKPEWDPKTPENDRGNL